MGELIELKSTDRIEVHIMPSLRLSPPGFLLCLLLVAPHSAPGLAEARDELARARTGRLATADHVTFAIPDVGWRKGTRSELFLVNRFAEPLEVRIEAWFEPGRRFPLAIMDLEPREFLRFDATAHLEAAAVEPGLVGLTVTYWGDPNMLQAWLVRQEPRGSLEWPLTPPLSAGEVVVSSWDLRPWRGTEGVEPRYFLRNVGTSPSTVTVRYEPLNGPAYESSLTLAPGEHRRLEPVSRGRFGAGIATFSHDEGDALAILGLLESRRFLSQLPIVLQDDALVEDRWEAVSIPHATARHRQGTGNGRPTTEEPVLFVVLSNIVSDGPPAEVLATLSDGPSGQLLQTQSIHLDAGATETLGFSIEASAADPAILSIVSTNPGIVPSALVATERGPVIDVALVPISKVHDSGTYPVPDPAEHDIRTTFLNLGRADAQLVGQLTWTDGSSNIPRSWALPPLTIPPGRALALDLNRLLDGAGPDRLGRLPPRSFQRGFFQWLSRAGSGSLIARTEVQRHEDDDWIGFNCFGCCEEWPRGEILPASTSFDIGSSAAFETLEWIDTCTGTIGPFTTIGPSLTFAPPLQWDGRVISSSDLTRQNPSFQKEGYYTWVDCGERRRVFGDSGEVVVDRCQKQHNPDYDVSKGCPGMFDNCVDCLACVDRELAVARCRCDRLIAFKETCRSTAERAALQVAQSCAETFLNCPGQ